MRNEEEEEVQIILGLSVEQLFAWCCNSLKQETEGSFEAKMSTVLNTLNLKCIYGIPEVFSRHLNI